MNKQDSFFFFVKDFAAQDHTFPRATHWLNSMDSIISLVSSGRLVMKRIWLGGCSGRAGAGTAGAAPPTAMGGAGAGTVGGGPATSPVIKA